MATLIKIGNSHGVRIPKAIIEQAHLQHSELQFKVVDDGLLIQPITKKPRHGWKEQFNQALKCQDASSTDQDWLDAPLTTDEDWEW